ncbi:helix-turn-helix domain-containing protein [Micromonospora haikouensis]|uniref:helix-turn-helix domain-containing protein n=1 Tax=Micromonospora haikouensis TaxID=686309 RepID=UPI003D71B71E
MSEHVKDALLATRDLKGTDRLVILTLAAHANDSGDAWPPVDVIADHVGCSDRTVQRTLARLVDAGRLTVRKVAGRAPRVYRIVGTDDGSAGEPSFVYFIDYGPTVKIGYSKDPVRRLARLKELEGRKDLRILATEPGGEDWEAFLHKEFADCRVGKSEQFLKVPALMAYVDSIAGGAL